MEKQTGFSAGQTLGSPKFNIRSAITVILLLVGIYFFIPKLIGIEESLKLVLKVNKIYLFLAIVSEIASYGGAAWLLGIILSRLGYKIPFSERFRIGSIDAFAMHFFPLGSLGEGLINFYFLSKRGVTAGSALLMFVIRIIITQASFLILFVLGLILVPTAPHLEFSPKFVALAIFSLIVTGIIYLIYLYEHREKFYRVWEKILNFLNSSLISFKKQPIGKEKANEVFEDLYKGFDLLATRKRSLVLGGMAGLIYWIGDILCLFFTLLSLGYFPHAGVLIFSYGVSTLAGLISTIPGGIGVTEGFLGIALNSLGVPLTVSVISILIFRLFSFWIWIPIGLISYITLQRRRK